MTLSKNRKEALSKYDNEKSYSLEDASNKLVKSLSSDLSNLILAESLERKFQP